ncbi:MAG: tetratricopeptide repeat protein, partial [Myxococcales bacterium]|nr:tetratricopeptide repeat protein [Myxococcales bacterium]
GVERPLTETTKLKAPESPAPTGGPKKKSDLLGSDVGRGGRSNKTGLNVESPTKGLKPQRSPDPKDGESLHLPGREGKKKRGHFEEKPKLGTRPGYLQDERDRTVKKPQKEPAPKQDPTPVVPNPTPTLAPPPRPSVVPAPTPTPKPALVVKRTLRPSGNKGSRRGDTTKRPTMVGDTTPPRRDYDKRPPVKARKKAKRKGSVTLDSLSQVETGKHRTTIDNAPRKKVRLKSKAGIKRETGFGLLGGAKRPQRRFYYRAPSIRPSRQRNEKESQNQRGPGPKGVVTSKKPTTVTKLQTHNAPETPRDVKRGKTAPDSSTTLKDPRKRRIEPNSKSLQPTLPQPRPKKAPSVSDKKSQKDFKSGKDFKSKVSKSPKEDREVRRPIVLDDQIRRKGDQILDRRRGHGKLTKQVPRNDLPRKRLPPSNKVTPKVVVRLAKTKSGRVDDRPGGERNKRERTTVISRLSFARAQARSGKLRLAVNEYRRVIAKTSGAARQQAQFELALLYLRLGWNAQATRLLVALKRSPRYATAATAMLNRLAQKSIVKRRVTAKKSKAAKRPVRRPKQKSDTSRTVK